MRSAPLALPRLALFTLVLFFCTGVVWTDVSAASPNWNAVVSPAGSVRLQRGGKEVATLSPGLFEKDWQFSAMSEAKAGQVTIGSSHQGKIISATGKVVEVQLQLSIQNEQPHFQYRLTPTEDIRLNSLHVNLSLPTDIWGSGGFTADGTTKPFPASFKGTAVHSGSISTLLISGRTGASLQLHLDQPTQVLLQDDRQWSEQFSVRIGPQMSTATIWPAGKSLSIAFTLTGDGGLNVEEDKPITITAGPNWLPLDVALDIKSGSALDFSDVIPRHSPAGKLGRVIVNSNGKFAFADQPATTAEFYGINLCFSAHYIDHSVADALAIRLQRLGYNSVRIHHYESELVDRSRGKEIRLKPEKLDQLDYLFAALKQRGFYVTTDLFVSRPVRYSVIYPTQTGEHRDIGMDEYKMAVHVNENAYNDFKSFAKILLTHVNPYTRMSYADDPALALISLVNEDNPGNFIGQLEGPLRDDWQTAWNRWLGKRYPKSQSLVAAIGKLPDDQDPSRGNVPLQNVRGDSPATVQFNIFLAEIEKDFFQRTRTFLRDELHCGALLTDMNAWTNPMQMQAVRADFDYVDDHFYVDHPKFLEQPWRLPSSCPNTSPIAEGAPGGRNCAFTRLYGKPFTITEFNYSSPGRFRGVGGILTGALGALQDWDGVWRFAYAHNQSNVVEPGPLNYFDVAADPLNQAAERASLCLFLRGDIQPAKHSFAITATTDQLLNNPAHSRDKTPAWDGLAWLARVGWTVVGDKPAISSKVDANQVKLPVVGGSFDPLDANATERMVAELRKLDWLDADNATNVAARCFQSDTGEVTIDAPSNTLVLDTARTAGGFAPAGAMIETENATIQILDTDATVWVSSLDENPIVSSKRLLVTHLTDLQNTDARYADSSRRVLLDWGRLPHLVAAGRATMTLRVTGAKDAAVYSLQSDGTRTGTLETTITAAGELVIPLSVVDNGKARMLYEVVVP
ncbi:hypothetical protein SH528x_000042 [Novipirellula sp. SH528]|uniref:hypothetical protein n=1 Tax=Novipirellula sp. SH528 TaxID=3454466 RepID=UPI003FA088B9